VLFSGPYFHQGHRFKPYSYYQDLPAGTLIYHTEVLKSLIDLVTVLYSCMSI